MALTRIKTQSILDREVREQDLADSAITFEKFRLVDSGNAGDVLTVDSFGNLLFTPADGTPRTLNQLDDVNVGGALPNQVLQYNATGTAWEPITIPGLSASSNTYIAVNIAGRDALVVNEADSCFVRSGISGEWEMYFYDSGFPGGPWILTATADSARTDANTIETLVDWNDSTPQLLGNVSNGSRITTISLEIITIFDGTDPAPKLSIGDDGDNGRIIGTDPLLDYLLEPDFDLKVAGTYTLNVDYVYDGTETAGTTDTDINAYFDFTGSTQGQVRVVVTHV